MRDAQFFARVFVLSIFVFSILALSYFYYVQQNTPEQKIKARLLALGYPENGYIFVGNTVKYADGREIVINKAGVELYTVNIYDATRAASSVIQPYQTKLSKYGYSLRIDYEHFTETSMNDSNYFVFTLYLSREGHNDDFLAGYVFVDRKTGNAFIKGLLG